MENVNFLKDAITKIEELHGKTFIVNADGNYVLIEAPDKYVPRTLDMCSLDALVQIFKTEAVSRDTLNPVYLMVGSFDARRTVKQYLVDALADEIKAGRVIVTL